MIEITNVGESPVKKFGANFEPGETKELNERLVSAYSLMEISQALQYLLNRLPRQMDSEDIHVHNNVHQHYTTKTGFLNSVKKYLRKHGGKA